MPQSIDVDHLVIEISVTSIRELRELSKLWSLYAEPNADSVSALQFPYFSCDRVQECTQDGFVR